MAVNRAGSLRARRDRLGEPIVQGGKLVGTAAVRFRCKAVIAPDRHAAWRTGAIAIADTGLHKSLCSFLLQRERMGGERWG